MRAQELRAKSAHDHEPRGTTHVNDGVRPVDPLSPNAGQLPPRHEHPVDDLSERREPDRPDAIIDGRTFKVTRKNGSELATKVGDMVSEQSQWIQVGTAAASSTVLSAVRKERAHRRLGR